MAALLALLGGICLSACQWLIYSYAPVEASMGFIQKIFYLHLPLSIWSLISFFVVFCGSIAYLFKKKTEIDNLCKSAAEVGVVFCALALASGMFWAKKSWGVWWTWDPRLTTTLVMWFVYSAYLVIGALDLPDSAKRRIRAILGIVAFLDVPLVFFSARIFRSIHPAVFGAEGGGLEPEMKLTAFACVISMGAIWGAFLWVRKTQLDLEANIRIQLFARADNEAGNRQQEPGARNG